MKDRLSTKLVVTAVTVGLISGAWLVLYFWVHFQLVESQTVDYVLLLAVGLGFPFLAWLAWIQRQDPPFWSSLANWSAWKTFATIGVFTTLIAGGVIRAINAEFDYHPAETFHTTTTHVYCGRAANLDLRGAPLLPTTTNTMTLDLFVFGDLDCNSTRLGDTVLVDIRRGLLGRPWVAGRTLAHPRQ